MRKIIMWCFNQWPRDLGSIVNLSQFGFLRTRTTTMRKGLALDHLKFQPFGGHRDPWSGRDPTVPSPSRWAFYLVPWRSRMRYSIVELFRQTARWRLEIFLQCLKGRLVSMLNYFSEMNVSISLSWRQVDFLLGYLITVTIQLRINAAFEELNV